MDKIYTVSDVAKTIGVSSETVRNWEEARLIPQATRVGLQKRRIWGPSKVEQIKQFAKDNGYLMQGQI